MFISPYYIFEKKINQERLQSQNKKINKANI